MGRFRGLEAQRKEGKRAKILPSSSCDFMVGNRGAKGKRRAQETKMDGQISLR